MIKQTLLVARKELRSFFDQPTAYILVVAFLGLGLFLTFRSVYAISAATLRPFFDFLPWLLVVFIPAVTMKSLAEERRTRTMEWLLAQPLTEVEIVVGKFLGNLMFVMITLAGTLPTAIGLLMQSEADPGIMVAQYLGATLLSAQMIAIGLWASSLTRNQIIAFILGAFISFGMLLIGTPVVQIGLPRLLGGWAAQLAVVTHFENVARGVVDLRDILYFISMCGLFLMLAVAALSRERLSKGGDAFRRLRLGTAVIAVAVLGLNLAGERVRGRLDLTSGNLFTLSDGSRQVLGNLDDVVNLRLFVSDDLPQELQLTLRDVRDLVADLAEASRGMLVTEEINPEDSEEAVQEAESFRIRPIEFNVLRDDELQVKRGYFGLAMTYANEQEITPVIDRTDDLEFRLVSAIANMTSERQPTLAFMSGFEAKEPSYYRAFQGDIQERYNITEIDIEADSTGKLSPDSIDVLVVAAPATPVTPEVATAIEDYLNAGGSAFLLMERHIIRPDQEPNSTPTTTGLEDLLAKRGVGAPAEMAFDRASNENVTVGRQGMFTIVQEYPLWPVALRGQPHATTNDLTSLSMGWAAPLTWELDDPTVTALWTTSENGGTQPGSVPINPSAEIPVPDDQLGVQTLAVAIDPALAEEDNGANVTEDESEEAEEGDEVGDTETPQRGRIIAVGDADFLEARLAGGNSQNDLFAANAVDWLAQDEALIGIRSKNRTPPQLVFESDLTKSVLKWGSLVGVPFLFTIFGFVRLTGRTARAERRWRGGGESAQPTATDPTDGRQSHD